MALYHSISTDIVFGCILISLTYVLYVSITHVLTGSSSTWLFRRSPLSDLPGPQAESWFKGNLRQLFNPNALSFHHHLVERYGLVVKIHGFFGDKQLYISDPVAIHSILNKEQDAFEETRVFTETNKIIFGEGLVATTGEQHRRQRKVINPVFSVSNLKALVPALYGVADRLCAAISAQLDSENNQISAGASRPVDIAQWMSRAALESVGQTMLDYSFDPLNSPHNNSYTDAVRGLVPALTPILFFRQLAPFLTWLQSPRLLRKIVEVTPIPIVQKIKYMSDLMYETAKSILRTKTAEAAILGGPSGDSLNGSKDIISMLLRENARQTEANRMSEEELIGQITVLVFGAQDTTSSALSRILYMLATNPEVQGKVREEIASAMASKSDGNNELSYDEVSKLPWLDAVIQETLRLHPPATFVKRSTLEQRTVPLSKPVINHDKPGVSAVHAVTIPKGTTLFVAIAAANRLEFVWGPDAKEWKPLRWIKPPADAEGPTSGFTRLPGAHPGSLTFLTGHRACIGYRFALLEMKIIVSTLLSRFAFSVTKDQVVWNFSQIIWPSIRVPVQIDEKTVIVEKQGLPLIVSPAKVEDPVK